MLALWLGAAALIGVSIVWGRRLQREAPEIFLGAAPLVGRSFRDGWDWRFGPSVLVAAAVAVVLAVATWRGWIERMRLRAVIGGSALASMSFAVALAAVDGGDGLRYGAAHESEYLAGLSGFAPAGEFVRTFVSRIDGYSVHVRGHPPGFVLLLKWLDAVGAGGVWPAVAVSVLSTGIIVVGVLVTVWAIAGDEAARRAAPFLAVTPYVLWTVTSADAFYAALGATAVASLAIAARSTGRVAMGAPVLAGLIGGLLLHMTYGGATFVLVPAVAVGPAIVARTGHRLAIAAGALAGAAAIVGAFVVAGFWWLDGARATKREYWEGTAQFRTWTYFGLANLAVAIIALGPATFAGVTRLRDRRVWLVVGGGMVALLVSHLSQYNRGEVERIWLLFYPWIAVASVGIAGRRRVAAMWVLAQAGSAIALQSALVSKW